MKACEQTGLDLPWYVNGTLDEAARASLEAHVPGCSRCRALLLDEQRLEAALHAGGTRVVPLPQSAWMAFERRLDRAGAETVPVPGQTDEVVRRTSLVPPASRASRGRWTFAGRMRRRALIVVAAAQAVALVLLAGLLWTVAPSPVHVYRTVTDTESEIASDRPLVRIVVAPGVTADRAQELARQAGMRVLAGPHAGNVFTLAVLPANGDSAAAATSKALSTLRERVEVLFAEQVSDGAPASGGPVAEQRP